MSFKINLIFYSLRTRRKFGASAFIFNNQKVNFAKILQRFHRRPTDELSWINKRLRKKWNNENESKQWTQRLTVFFCEGISSFLLFVSFRFVLYFWRCGCGLCECRHARNCIRRIFFFINVFLWVTLYSVYCSFVSFSGSNFTILFFFECIHGECAEQTPAPTISTVQLVCGTHTFIHLFWFFFWSRCCWCYRERNAEMSSLRIIVFTTGSSENKINLFEFSFGIDWM